MSEIDTIKNCTKNSLKKHEVEILMIESIATLLSIHITDESIPGFDQSEVPVFTEGEMTILKSKAIEIVKRW